MTRRFSDSALVSFLVALFLLSGLVISTPQPAFAKGVRFYRQFAPTLEAAKKSKKWVLIDFYTDW